jgi:predicted nucleic acid-binding protein
LIEAVDFLPALFGSVVIPGTVAAELTDPHAPHLVRNWMARHPSWLTITEDPPLDEMLNTLDPGERAAITLARSISASRLLIDDSDGRAEAERRGLRITGTLGVLAAAHRSGLVNFDSAIARLSITNFYVSPRLLATARRLLFAVAPR